MLNCPSLVSDNMMNDACLSRKRWRRYVLLVSMHHWCSPVVTVPEYFWTDTLELQSYVSPPGWCLYRDITQTRELGSTAKLTYFKEETWARSAGTAWLTCELSMCEPGLLEVIFLQGQNCRRFLKRYPIPLYGVTGMRKKIVTKCC